ncbi:MAG TPA: hypothetical protein VE089_09015 [Nitrososphaeraceae archaeon]|jgi:hypothetical protein|nr:hypothetical protein [Nitrososphaeraceae archaeon]
MNNFDQLEEDSKKYAELKQHTELISKSITIAVSIIDYVSSQNFSFPLQSKGVVSGGTTTYLYINNSTYPNFFEFIAEILHMKIPIIINGTKFGPGEIIVNRGNEQDALYELGLCIRELQKLIYAKKHNLYKAE